jgi:hypothetical protein
MCAKTLAAWTTSLVLLALATFAWYAYVANGMVYGDLFGLSNERAAASLARVRSIHFLVLALTAEATGVGAIRVANDHRSE